MKYWEVFLNRKENDRAGESKEWKKDCNSSQAKGEDAGLWDDPAVKL